MICERVPVLVSNTRQPAITLPAAPRVLSVLATFCSFAMLLSVPECSQRG